MVLCCYNLLPFIMRHCLHVMKLRLRLGDTILIGRILFVYNYYLHSSLVQLIIK